MAAAKTFRRMKRNVQVSLISLGISSLVTMSRNIQPQKERPTASTSSGMSSWIGEKSPMGREHRALLSLEEVLPVAAIRRNRLDRLAILDQQQMREALAEFARLRM